MDTAMKIWHDHQKGSVVCSCGHVVCISKIMEKQICSWCGKLVYRDPKAEFKDKLLKEMRR